MGISISAKIDKQRAKKKSEEDEVRVRIEETRLDAGKESR